MHANKKQKAVSYETAFSYAPEIQKTSNQLRDDILKFNELIHLYELQIRGLKNNNQV